jgi:hypothetical protein
VSREDVAAVLQLVMSPGAAVAVRLAAFSGLRPAELKGLVLRDFVDLSLSGLRFSAMPPRINVRIPRTFRRFYTFFSTGSCLDLVADLKARKVSTSSPAVSDQAFREADKAVYYSVT